MALGMSPGCVLRARVMVDITTRCGTTCTAKTVGVKSCEYLLIENSLVKGHGEGRDNSARSSRPRGPSRTPEAGPRTARVAHGRRCPTTRIAGACPANRLPQIRCDLPLPFRRVLLHQPLVRGTP